MSLIEDFGLYIPSRKIPLLILSVEDEKGEKKTDILHMNKIIKLYQEISNSDDIQFSNFNLGAVSYEVEESIDILQEVGLIEEVEKRKYKLTKDGEEAVRMIKRKLSEEEMRRIEYSKKLLNDLDFNELLFYMYMRFPNTQENSTQIRKLKIMQKGIINKLVNKGKIDNETAIKRMKSN